MNSTPFLTLPDPEVAIKGSRDPFGYEVLWIGFGRKIVGNLTTVTTSLRGFTTLLLGYYFISSIIESNENFSEDDFVKLFMKFEQLTAYSRFANDSWQVDGMSDIRGIERVKYNYSEGKEKVVISASQKNQILAEQKTYGLWGLFSVSARNSGLIENDSFRITAEAREFVEKNIIPLLEKKGNLNKKIMEILTRESYILEPKKGGKDALLCSTITDLHKLPCTNREIEFYSKQLLFGGMYKQTFQNELWGHLVAMGEKRGRDFWDYSFTRSDLRHLIPLVSDPFRELLIDIDALDWLLLITNQVFNFLLTKHGFDVKDVVSQLDDFGNISGLINLERLEKIQPEIAKFSDSDHAERLIKIAELIKNKDNNAVVEMLINHNAEVMKRRWGGGAWIVIKKGKFQVRFGREYADLKDLADMNKMYSTYFMNSIKQIGKQIYGY